MITLQCHQDQWNQRYMLVIYWPLINLLTILKFLHSRPPYWFLSTQTGDVILFLSPEDQNMHYIKRVIAGPGDHVVYKDKQYGINGETAEFSEESLQENDGNWLSTYTETLSGVEHAVQIDQRTFNHNDVDLVVPEEHYFVSGDNRDFSYDSRYFGPISQDLIVGKATHIITQFSYPIHLLFSRSGKIK